MANINDFKAKLAGGGARANQFKVTMPFPGYAQVGGEIEDLAFLCTSTTYAVFDSGYKYMYDRYSDLYRFVPLNGDIAGLAARTDILADAWFSPAGLNRGVIRGAAKLAYNPTKTQRDDLYTSRVNPVATFSGQGTILFGDKTGLSSPSAFDRINVRPVSYTHLTLPTNREV